MQSSDAAKSPRCRQLEPPQLSPGGQRHGGMPGARGSLCPGERCRTPSSRRCVPCPAPSGTGGAPSHGTDSSRPRPGAGACHGEGVSCRHPAGGRRQAEFSSGHRERLGATCAKHTFAGSCRCRGQPAQPRCGQEQRAAWEPPWLPSAPALPPPWSPGPLGLQLHEGGCSSSATWQVPGKRCPKTQHDPGTRVSPPGPAASFPRCPTAPPSDGQAVGLPLQGAQPSEPCALPA